tara:strand:+ start:428 stop:709 length:282 start_codon:yes stop_codon:yes gene_type:complete
MDDHFIARANEILKEFTSGLQKTGLPNKPGGENQEETDVNLKDSDLQDPDIQKAAASGDKVKLVKAVQKKREMDKAKLDQEITDIKTAGQPKQ